METSDKYPPSKSEAIWFYDSQEEMGQYFLGVPQELMEILVSVIFLIGSVVDFLN